MAEVFTALGSALYAKLAAGTALTNRLGGTVIWDTLVPQGTGTPYVVFNYSGGGDENLSPVRTRNLVYTVKTVASGFSGKLQSEQIDGEVDSLLHMGTLTLTGWNNWWMARTSDIAYTEMAGGTVFWHRGGQYRIRIVDP